MAAANLGLDCLDLSNLAVSAQWPRKAPQDAWAHRPY